MKKPHRRPPPEYIIRDYTPHQDEPLVFDSWTKQIGCVCPLNSWRSEDRKQYRRETLERLVIDCPTKVASHPDAGVVIYGWACGGLTLDNQQVLHFLFVRSEWRGRGIAKALLELLMPDFLKRDLYYTHNSRMARRLQESWKAHWNPYLINEELV